MEKQTVLPKNIRQIGEIRGQEKIYLEDYVMTYIRKKEETKGYLGVFLGERQEVEGQDCFFIRGILEVLKPQEDQTEESWKEALEESCKTYFPDWKIQGCCVIGSYPTKQMEQLGSVFPEAENLLYHLQEQEESLYRKIEGQYERIKGYFVFYEQNRKMQEYMAEVFRENSVEKESLPDKAIRSFREKVKEKSEHKSGSMMKLAGSFFVVGMLAVGAIAVNRVEDIRAVRNMGGDLTSENEAVSSQVQSATEEAQRLVNGALMQEQAETERFEIRSTEEEQTESTLAGPDSFWQEAESETAQETVKETVKETAQEAAAMRQIQASYVIRRGDTLADICKRYYGSLDQLNALCEANGISDANVIMPGQKIVLP